VWEAVASSERVIGWASTLGGTQCGKQWIGTQWHSVASSLAPW
jgi:hypothetical protein